MKKLFAILTLFALITCTQLSLAQVIKFTNLDNKTFISFDNGKSWNSEVKKKETIYFTNLDNKKFVSYNNGKSWSPIVKEVIVNITQMKNEIEIESNYSLKINDFRLYSLLDNSTQSVEIRTHENNKYSFGLNEIKKGLYLLIYSIGSECFSKPILID